MPAERKDRLMPLQAALADALTGQASAPAGFDPDRIRLACQLLLEKRRRSVAHILPQTALSLGESFTEWFSRYSAAAPHPPAGGPLEDALGFSQPLRASDLSDPARIECFNVRLRIRSRLAWTQLSTGRIIFGARLPLLGVKALGVPFARGVLQRKSRHLCALSGSSASLR